jgi:hypothetical protein
VTKFWALIKAANKLYESVKKGMDQKGSTHEFITLQALDLLGVNDLNVRQRLEKACMAPDRQSDLRRLVFEGHFYGTVAGERMGNFLERVFDNLASGPLGLVDQFVDDIDETALSNFEKYYMHAMAGNIKFKELGWAAHSNG